MRALPSSLLLTLATACSGAPAAAPPPAPVAAAVPDAPHPHDELHLPPPGPVVHVSFEGTSVDLDLTRVAHDGKTAPLAALFRTAFPSADLAALRFDLVGSDGFHPASRPACAKPLTANEVGAAHIDIATHDVSFDEPVKLPGCYRVKAVVSMTGTR